MGAAFSPHQLKVDPDTASVGTYGSHTDSLKEEKAFAAFHRPFVGHFRNIREVTAFERSERIIHKQRLCCLCPEL